MKEATLQQTDPEAIERDGRARALLAIAVIVYIWLFIYWTTRNHDGLGSQAFDLGIYDQGVWLLSRLERPFITINGRHLYGDHTTFILLPFAAIYRVLPTAKVLLTAQALALGLGAVPVFLLARDLLRRESLAAVLAAVYLIQPVLGWTNLEQFHPEVFEVPLLLFAIWYAERHRWRGYFVCVVLLLLVKEDVALATIGLGFYVLLKHNRRIGWITIGLSAYWIFTAFALILPAFTDGGTVYNSRIAFGGPGGFLRKLLSHPGEVIEYLLTRKRFWYIWQLLAPVAFVAAFAPAVLLIGVLPLAFNLISGFGYQHDIHFHYSTTVFPVIMAATVFAIARLSPEMRRIGVGAVVAASLVCAFLWGPTPLWRDHPFVADPSGQQVAAFRRAQRLLPAKAIVSAHYGWVPQISHRKEIYMFPNPWKASYWGTFKQEGQRLPEADRVQYILVPSQQSPEAQGVLDSIRSDFTSVFERDGVLLLKRNN